ncbi:MarR family transcriptional regulator [Streptomyces sp. NPDC050147]|uniref:MarR family winged helix-turn-helix transcriptional regulator n=1 Tax=Streptomyces sp. NPDC050147 TaxID=3155513 RepID=UPI00341A779C
MDVETGQAVPQQHPGLPWQALSTLHGQLEAGVRSVLQERSDLSVREFSLLLALERKEHESGPEMHRLTAAMGLSPSAVTRLASRLEKRELVTRTYSATNRRCICPVLTSAGRTLVERLRPPASQARAGGAGQGQEPARPRPAGKGAVAHGVLARHAEQMTPRGPCPPRRTRCATNRRTRMARPRSHVEIRPRAVRAPALTGPLVESSGVHAGDECISRRSACWIKDGPKPLNVRECTLRGVRDRPRPRRERSAQHPGGGTRRQAKRLVERR